MAQAQVATWTPDHTREGGRPGLSRALLCGEGWPQGGSPPAGAGARGLHGKGSMGVTVVFRVCGAHSRLADGSLERSLPE